MLLRTYRAVIWKILNFGTDSETQEYVVIIQLIVLV